MLRVIPYNGGTGNYNPAVQTGDFLFVIGNVSGTIDSHSRTLSGLRIDGVNNTFSGSLTVTSNLSTTNITTTNITCTNLYSFNKYKYYYTVYEL